MTQEGAVMAEESGLVQLLCDLIALPSVNPEADALRSSPPYGEQRVAQFVERYFAPYSVKVQRRQAMGPRESVLVRLEAHMDTVDAGTMNAPFTPRVRDNRVYGRGACDTKGSLAAMMYAVRHLLDEGIVPLGDIILAAVADEEYGMTGARNLAAVEGAYRGAVVGEPTSLRIIPAHDGQMYVRIVTRGTAAHTSAPQLGRNAIYLMNEVISILRRRSKRDYALRSHPLCGEPKLTVSMIQGGVSEHIVPDRCEIAVDFRIIPGESCAQAWSEAQDWLQMELDPHSRTRTELSEPYKSEPPMETPSNHPLVQAMRRAAAEVAGSAEIAGAPYNTDASHYGAAGVPCVVFGPGDVAQAHSSDEWVDIGQLAAAYRVLLALLGSALL
jgi:succinyl-diaminopimelate desuccinylase